MPEPHPHDIDGVATFIGFRWEAPDRVESYSIFPRERLAGRDRSAEGSPST